MANNTVNPQMRELGEIFEKHKNLVFKTAYLMYGNREDADEALQEVFIQVFRSLSGYDPAKGAMSTWLYRITINHCLAHQRKHRISLEPLENISAAASDDTLENRILQDLDKQTVQDAILGLSEKLRAVIVLRFYWDLPYKEIAQILSIPLGTVKSRIDLALRSLGAGFQKSTTEQANEISPIWENVA